MEIWELISIFAEIWMRCEMCRTVSFICYFVFFLHNLLFVIHYMCKTNEKNISSPYSLKKIKGMIDIIFKKTLYLNSISTQVWTTLISK